VAGRFEPLLALARRQQALVETGRFDELPALEAEWARVVSSIEDATPEEREALEEIEAIVWSTVATLDKAHHETARALHVIGRGRSAIRSYAGGARGPAAAVNIRG
jgi:hypothetical protein